MKNVLAAAVALSVAAMSISVAGAADRVTAAEFIADYAAKHEFNGSILLQENGKIVYTKSFGLADFAFKIPNTPETKYKIASITKLFTSTLVLQLAEQGRLDLDKTIHAYLPGYAGPAGDKVTLRELLNHTSGIQNFDQVKSAEDAIQNGIPNYQHPYTSEQLLAKFASGPLVHEPGRVFDYNNGDYVILGEIIARVCAKPYELVLKERILDPLGMADSGFLHQSDIVANLAPTYFHRSDLKALANDLPSYPQNWYAAGAMYSTPNDLVKFANALFGLKLIGKASLDRMIQPGLDDYGYGLWSYDTKVDGRSYKVVKRPGQIMGAQTQLYHIFDPEITIIILSNTGTTDLDDFVAQIGKKMVEGK